jgi:diadenosine tetraphosphate (Ap4A) HIT family hydrolase
MSDFYTITPAIDGRIIAKNEHAMCFLALMPIVPGHVLIAPLRPVKLFSDMNAEETKAIFELMGNVKEALKVAFGARGFNHAWNEESIAGQTVDHFHLHVLPRKAGDSGITTYEPRDFLYRNMPVEDRPASPQEEMDEVVLLIRNAMTPPKR